MRDADELLAVDLGRDIESVETYGLQWGTSPQEWLQRAKAIELPAAPDDVVLEDPADPAVTPAMPTLSVLDPHASER